MTTLLALLFVTGVTAVLAYTIDTAWRRKEKGRW